MKPNERSQEYAVEELARGAVPYYPWLYDTRPRFIERFKTVEQNRTNSGAVRDATHFEGLLGRLEEQGNSLYDVVGRVEALLARLDDDHSDEKTPDETSAAPTTGLLPQLCRAEDRIDEWLSRVRAALDRLEGLV